jgi:type IV secretory pathway TrbD component
MQLRSEIRRIPIRRALVRNHMLLGGERSLVLFSALSSSLVGFSIAMGKNFVLGLFIGASCWTIIMLFLKMMGKHDPQISTVFKRSYKYKSFYPAQGRYTE